MSDAEETKNEEQNTTVPEGDQASPAEQPTVDSSDEATIEPAVEATAAEATTAEATTAEATAAEAPTAEAPTAEATAEGKIDEVAAEFVANRDPQSGFMDSYTMPDDEEEEEELLPEEPYVEPAPVTSITQQDVLDCFDDEDLSWDSYRNMQKVAVSSDANRRTFEAETAKIDEDKNGMDATKKGACLYILGHVIDARETLDKAHPAIEMASVLLGKLLEDAEKWIEAKKVYSEAVAVNPQGKQSVFGLAKVHYVLGEVKEAEELILKTEAEFEGDPELYFLKGFAQELEGEYEDARDLYEKVLEIDPEHPRALFRLGRYHMTWGEEEKAVEYYEKCVQQVPTYGNALINLGLLYEDRDNYDDACRCYQTVLKAIPDHHRATMFLKDAEASKIMYYDEERERRVDRQNQVLKIPVSDFELSVRSRNCLNKMNIKTLGDLMNMTEPELLAHKNFGETSLLEVKQMLAQKGLRLGQNRGQTSGFTTRTGTQKVLPKEDVVKQSVANLELSVRSRNCMNRLGIKTVEELLSRSEQELLAAKNFGETSLNEIKSRLTEIGLSLRRGR
jgi:DNA-directed RNA polymerase subunit alpha